MTSTPVNVNVEPPSTPIHDNIKPLAWILGKWVSFHADGHYPTLKNFTFGDSIQFESKGQPLFIFRQDSKNAVTGNPMHLERGFLSMKPGTDQVAFVIAHTSGLTTIEEGTMEGQKIVVETICINKSTVFKLPPKVVEKTRRTYSVEDDILTYKFDLQTDETPLTNHLIVKYRRE